METQTPQEADTVARVEACIERSLREDPGFKQRSLTILNREAVEFYNKRDFEGAIAVYAKIFRRVREENLTHSGLHICYGNRSAAWYRLGLYTQALQDAERSRTLAESAIQRSGVFCRSYVKAYLRKGAALLAMGRAREASTVLNEGLTIEPSNVELRVELELATRQLIGDLIDGKGKQVLCLPAAAPCERISNLAYATPLHKIKAERLLPTKLLTPQQAERDHHIRDTYNYVTIKTDTEMPMRSLRKLRDNTRCELFAEAVRKAVQRIEGRIIEPRVLSLASGTALTAMVALKAGVKHVTLAERWLYLALSCKETLEANQFTEDQFKVVYKRPSDLSLTKDVPICCNICVNEFLDDGLLTSGLVPAFRQSLEHLLIHDPILIPASATVNVQAIELTTGRVCGFDLSAVDQYRSDGEGYRVLSDAYEAWHFDFYHPPEESARHEVDLKFTADGVFNAVLFWYELDLGEGLRLSTAPSMTSPASTLQPCVQYLPGQLSVERDMVYPLLCSHNTVRLRFDIEEAEYLHLTKEDASFPHRFFEELRDGALLEGYARAIQAAYAPLKDRNGRVDALDVGCGGGILSLLCAEAGCASVVACDIHESMVDITRKSVARNRFSSVVTAVCADAASLKRGTAVPYHGANLVVTQLIDSGLLGYNVLGLMDTLRRNIMQHDAVTIPQKAVVYCIGIEVATPSAMGFDFKALESYRWDEAYTKTDLDRLPHRELTPPTKVFEFSLDGCQHGRGRETILRLKTERSGRLNGVAFWYDLHLDANTVITTAPERFQTGGVTESADLNLGGGELWQGRSRHMGQALQYLDASLDVDQGQRVILIAKRDGNRLTFRLKQGVGEPVERAPWKVQWGGGASVENPHYQRVHYCQLLVNDFKMRCKGSRFPSIREDLEIMHRHCGSLFLDPASLTRIGQELVVTEMLCQRDGPTPCATVEAIVGTQHD